MQGFPTLFAYEVMLDDVFHRNFQLPSGFSSYLGGHTRESYLQLLKETMIGDLDPENIILLEIFPHKQKTKIDFYCTEEYLGIKPVCLTELIKEGKKLFYLKETRPDDRLNDSVGQAVGRGTTTVTVDLDTTEDFIDYMNETYPKALDKLKELCEK
jgi:hypothetical protein